MTPCGYPKFDSYVKNLRVLVFITDGQTDRQPDRQRNQSGVGWVTYWFLQVNNIFTIKRTQPQQYAAAAAAVTATAAAPAAATTASSARSPSPPCRRPRHPLCWRCRPHYRPCHHPRCCPPLFTVDSHHCHPDHCSPPPPTQFTTSLQNEQAVAVGVAVARARMRVRARAVAVAMAMAMHWQWW